MRVENVTLKEIAARLARDGSKIALACMMARPGIKAFVVTPVCGDHPIAPDFRTPEEIAKAVEQSKQKPSTPT